MSWLRQFCVLVLLVPPAVAGAQQGDIATGSGSRPFAEPIYWLNATTDDRLPIRERAMTRTEGLTNFAPPPPRRSGLTPRLGFATEFRRADDGRGGDDVILNLSPGLHYTRRGAKWIFDADYGFETAQHLEQTNLSKIVGNHGGFASFAYELSPATRLTFFDSLFSTQDTSTALVAGALAPDTVLTGNDLLLGAAYRFSARTNAEITYTNRIQLTNQSAQTDIFSHDVSGQLHHFLTPKDRVGATARLSWFDFELGGNDSVVAGDLRYTRDFGERFAATARLGALGTSAEGGRTLPTYGAELTATTRFARLSLTAERDLSSTPGIVGPLLTDQIVGTAHMRLDRGLQLRASVEQQWLQLLDGSDTDISVTTLEAQLSYAVDRYLWVWTRLRYSRESSSGDALQDGRIYVGITRSLDFGF